MQRLYRDSSKLNIIDAKEVIVIDYFTGESYRILLSDILVLIHLPWTKLKTEENPTFQRALMTYLA